MRKPTQNDQVYAWLQTHESITRRSAMIHLGIANLPARILELRRKGHNIQNSIVTTATKKRYVEYYLAEEL